MRVKNLNKQKCFIVPATDVISGGRDLGDGTVRIEPNNVVDMVAEKAIQLSETYDGVLNMDEKVTGSKRTKKEK